MSRSAGLNKVLIERFYREVTNPDRHEQIIDELVAPDVVVHHVPYDGNGADLLKSVWSALHHAFDDLRFELEHVMAEDDQIAVRGVTSGIHVALFAGHEPTGEQVSERAHVFYRVLAGRIREVWPMVDRAGLLRQLAG